MNRSIFEQLEPRLLLSGTEYVVTSLADVVATDGVVTLREALEAANSNTAITGDVLAGSSTDPDVITFNQTLLLAEAGAGNPLTIILGGTELTITDDVEIVGLGSDILTIDANDASRVVSITGAQSDADIAGMTITGGYATGDGGGISIVAATLTLTDVTASSNSAGSNGGGIYNVGTLTLIDSTVSDNSADDFGGGIYNDDTLTLVNSTVSDNSTGIGGGIVNNGTLTLTNVAVTGNTATDEAGGIYNTNSLMTMTDVTISSNSAGSNGGGVYNEDGGMTMTGGEIIGNSAGPDGGGIYNGGSISLVDVNIVGNSSSLGGGVYNFGTFKLTTGNLSGNIASIDGGGLYNQGAVTLANVTLGNNSAVSSGGGLLNAGGAVTLTSATVAGNSAATGGGIRNETGGPLTLNNTIVTSNNANTSDDISGTWSGSNNLVGVGQLFIRNPSAGTDTIWGTADDYYGDLRLRSTSSAVDAGSNVLAVDADGIPLVTDVAGNTRIYGAIVDIGAYEYHPGVVDIDHMAAVIAEGSYVPSLDFNTSGAIDSDDMDHLVQVIFATEYGDANLDQKVDIVDLAILANSYGSSAGGWSEADFDGSGYIDIIDLAILAAHYGFDGTAAPAASSAPMMAATQSQPEPVKAARTEQSQPATIEQTAPGKTSAAAASWQSQRRQRRTDKTASHTLRLLNSEPKSLQPDDDSDADTIDLLSLTGLSIF